MERLEELGKWVRENEEGIFNASYYEFIQQQKTTTGIEVRFTKSLTSRCVFMFFLTDALKGNCGNVVTN